MDVSRLTKLLNLSASDNDNEALSAIRKANDLLRKEKAKWEDILSPKSTSNMDDFLRRYHQNKQDKWRNQIYEADKDPEDMIREIRDNAWDGFDFTFIDSLSDRIDSGKRLTFKQYEALKRIHEKLRF